MFSRGDAGTRRKAGSPSASPRLRVKKSAACKVAREVHRCPAFLRLRDGRGRPGGDDVSALLARAWSDVDDPIGAGDYAHVVLDDDHRVAGETSALRSATARAVIISVLAILSERVTKGTAAPR